MPQEAELSAIERWILWYQDVLTGTGMSADLVLIIENVTIIVITAILALVADFLVKKIIIGTITRIARRSKNDWDDIFIERKVFNRLAHLAPAIIVYGSLQYIFEAEKLVTFLGNITQAYMVIVVLLVIDAVLNALHEVYRRLPISEGKNIKGYVQVVKIIFYAVAIILVISIFSGRAPSALIASLGAMAAVLILVFRDTILGFVASILRSSSSMWCVSSMRPIA